MYCAPDDLLKQIPPEKLAQLADDDKDGEPDGDLLSAAIAEAGAEIDSYAGKQYTLPFAAAPAVLKKFAVDVAIYNLFSRRGFNLSPESGDYNIYLRYKAAVDFLKRLAAGDVKLDAGGEDSPAGAPAGADIRAEPRLFTRQKLRGF